VEHYIRGKNCKYIVENVKVGFWGFIVFKIHNTPTDEKIRDPLGFLGIKQ